MESLQSLTRLALPLVSRASALGGAPGALALILRPGGTGLFLRKDLSSQDTADFCNWLVQFGVLWGRYP